MRSSRPPPHSQSGPALLATYGLNSPRTNEKKVPTRAPNNTENPSHLYWAIIFEAHDFVAVSESRQGAKHVRDHHCRQLAETRLARGDQQALARLAGKRRRARAGEARRDAALAEGAGGRRHRHRQRWRAVAAALRARLPRAG